MLYPLTFQPIFKERVWGGRKLAELYGKQLPPDVAIGESWEISDRPGDASVIANGRFAGKDLNWLFQTYGKEVLGQPARSGTRFPLLIKILDAREKLSLQVHPPASRATRLGGEPKTEMWYIAAADPGAELYVGLKSGVGRREFEEKIRSGAVADCFHRVSVNAGDTMFLPSGRVHAIGAGLVIFEIQQNSDTTYRVFDWNRKGLDGQPRPLHVPESLESIDFKDFEPSLVNSTAVRVGEVQIRHLVADPLFSATECDLSAEDKWRPQSGMLIIGLVSGAVKIAAGADEQELRPGGFCLVPACCQAEVRAITDARFLVVRAGQKV